MKRTIILYGLLLGLLGFLLKYFEFRFYIHDLTVEVYVLVVALICTGLGVWFGRELTSARREPLPAYSNPPATAELAEQDSPETTPDTTAIKRIGITSREYEVLVLIAEGLSNQEIADRLFVSLNTVKTHSTNLFAKLDVRRRTQAVQRAKEWKILP